MLIHPPHTRNTEPPLGVALLAAFLKRCGAETRVVDLNAAAGPHLALTAGDAGKAGTHRARRAFLHIKDSLQALQNHRGYENRSKYQAHVEYYATALNSAAQDKSWTITPGDFTDRAFSSYTLDSCRQYLMQSEAHLFHPFYEGHVPPIMSDFQPDLILLSIIYRSQFLPGIVLADWLKRQQPDCSLLLGGGFFNAIPSGLATGLGQHLAPIVSGPGEKHLSTLLEAPADADLHFRDPDFGDLDFSRYFAPGKILPITSSRGCYWRQCAFCAETQEAFHGDPPEDFLQRLKRLAERCDPALFHFTDNAIPPVILKALARHGSPAPWYGFVRARPELADFAYVKALKDAGCAMLQIGFETPAAECLDRLQKGVDPAHYGPIIDNLRKAGIKSYGYFLFGLPGQTPEDSEETLRFLRAHPVDFLNAAIFRLPPGTPIARSPEDFDITAADPQTTQDRLYGSFEGEGPARQALRQWMSGAFSRDPIIRQSLQRTPRYFKSNHAVYF